MSFPASIRVGTVGVILFSLFACQHLPLQTPNPMNASTGQRAMMNQAREAIGPSSGYSLFAVPHPAATPAGDCCVVHGGGWFPKDGKRVIFSFLARKFADGTVNGHVRVLDQTTGKEYVGKVTLLDCSDSLASFGGTLKDGTPFGAAATDLATPGKDQDALSFVTAGTTLVGFLGGGDIKLTITPCD